MPPPSQVDFSNFRIFLTDFSYSSCNLGLYLNLGRPLGFPLILFGNTSSTNRLVARNEGKIRFRGFPCFTKPFFVSSGTNTGHVSGSGMKKWLKFTVYGIAASLALMIAFLLLGPRPRVEPVTALPSLPENWQNIHLEDKRLHPDLRPDTEKRILWIDPRTKAKTRLSLVFFHGYSASRDEINPILQRVGKELGANIYFSRLPGHGIPGDAMGQTDVQHWVEEGLLGWQFGKALGDKVVLVGVSTGSTLATWLSFQDHLGVDPHGLILVAPNYGPKDPRSELMVLSGARVWAPILGGTMRSWPADDAESLRIWTNPHPTVSVIPMMALVVHTRRLPFDQANDPALFVYSENDTVVEATLTHGVYGEWPDALKERWMIELPDPHNNHNILGDLRSPEKTDEAVERFTTFIRQLEN